MKVLDCMIFLIHRAIKVFLNSPQIVKLLVLYITTNATQQAEIKRRRDYKNYGHKNRLILVVYFQSDRI